LDPNTPEKENMTPSNLKLDRRLAAYGTLAGVALTVPAATTSHAAIVYSGPVNISVPNSVDGIYFNLVTGQSGSVAIAVPGWDINAYNNGTDGFTLYGAPSPSGVLATGTPGNSAIALNLAMGTPISSTGQYNQFETLGSQFQGGGNGYLGLRFQNEVTGIQNYGWILFNTTAGTGINGGFPASIIGYAYENTGASINAGAIPEPSTAALLGVVAAGALGLREWRRRKAA
jgi:PEP-CTERM motif